MNAVKARRLRREERRQLHQLMRQRMNHVNVSHARIILLSRSGVGNREIARQVGCTADWVRKIIHRFNQKGVPGIEWYPGRQVHGARKFDADVTEQIAEVALSSPKSLIGMNQWSLSKLREYLISQEIVSEISLEWLRQLLRRHGIRWRRTKTWKESADPEFWPKYRRIRGLYRRRPRGGRRICVDEFGPLNLQPRQGSCWAKPGKKRVDRHRATYHRFGGVRHFLAAYDLETGRLFGQFKARKTRTEFLQFLKWLRRRYPKTETLHIVLDNYSPHLASEVRRWAEANNVKFYFTPSQASWLNRIECQFTALRKFALENSDFRSHEEQQTAIESYLAWRNGRRDIAVEPWRDSIHKTKRASAVAAAA